MISGFFNVSSNIETMFRYCRISGRKKTPQPSGLAVQLICWGNWLHRRQVLMGGLSSNRFDYPFRGRHIETDVYEDAHRLLSCQDIVEMLRYKLPSKIQSDEDIVMTIANRHRRRQIASASKYKKTKRQNKDLPFHHHSAMESYKVELGFSPIHNIYNSCIFLSCLWRLQAIRRRCPENCNENQDDKGEFHCEY